MDLNRQVLRWAIPGWLLIIFLLTFVMVSSVWHRPIVTWDTLVTGKGVSPELVIAAGGLGIPIGYLLYQFYWWMHWANPPGHIVSRDAGYEILKDADIDFDAILGVSLDETSKQAKILIFRWLPFLGLRYLKEKPPDVTERYQRNWYLADYVWYATICQLDGHECLEQRAILLYDVCHSLGTSRLSLMIAGVAYALSEFIRNWHLVIASQWCEYLRVYVGPLFSNFTIACILLFILSHGREDTLESWIALKHHVITYHYGLKGRNENQAEVSATPE